MKSSLFSGSAYVTYLIIIYLAYKYDRLRINKSFVVISMLTFKVTNNLKPYSVVYRAVLQNNDSRVAYKAHNQQQYLPDRHQLAGVWNEEVVKMVQGFAKRLCRFIRFYCIWML
jgi:hypothetical protein